MLGKLRMRVEAHRNTDGCICIGYSETLAMEAAQAKRDAESRQHLMDSNHCVEMLSNHLELDRRSESLVRTPTPALMLTDGMSTDHDESSVRCNLRSSASPFTLTSGAQLFPPPGRGLTLTNPFKGVGAYIHGFYRRIAKVKKERGNPCHCRSLY